MLVAQPCCSEYQGPIFLPIQFFSPFQSATHFSISHTGCYKLHFESIEIFVFFYLRAELTSELNGRPSSQNVFVTDTTKSRFC